MCNSVVKAYFNTSYPGGDQQGRQEWRRRKRSWSWSRSSPWPQRRSEEVSLPRQIQGQGQEAVSGNAGLVSLSPLVHYPLAVCSSRSKSGGRRNRSTERRRRDRDWSRDQGSLFVRQSCLWDRVVSLHYFCSLSLIQYICKNVIFPISLIDWIILKFKFQPFAKSLV